MKHIILLMLLLCSSIAYAEKWVNVGTNEPYYYDTESVKRESNKVHLTVKYPYTNIYNKSVVTSKGTITIDCIRPVAMLHDNTELDKNGKEVGYVNHHKFGSTWYPLDKGVPLSKIRSQVCE